jgi:monoamine oxidase
MLNSYVLNYYFKNNVYILRRYNFPLTLILFMTQFKKTARDPFLRSLQKAFALFLESKKNGAAPVNELIEKSIEKKALQRRSFLSGIAKTGVVLTLGGVLEACKKIGDLPGANNLDSQINSTANTSQPRIAILGAGVAGLNCAYQLAKKGIYATVYEASGRTGGRILTKNNFISPGLYTECGGEFIDSGHKHMLKLAREFNLPLIDTEAPSEAGLAKDSFYINGHYYDEAAVMQALMPYAEKISADINSLPAYFDFENYTPAVSLFDNMSIAGYFTSLGMPASSFLRKGLEVAYNTEYGTEVSEQSAINFLFLFSVNPNKGTYKIFGVSDERYKIEGGNQRITDALFNALQGQVQLNKLVTKIKLNNNNVYKLYFDDSSTALADILIVTIPFSVLRNINLTELALPTWKKNAIQNLGYGTNSKLIMGFNERVWRNYQHSGYLFTNGNAQAASNYIQTGWDSSQLQPVTQGSYTVFQGGNQGLALSLAQAPVFLQQLNTIWPGTAAAYTGTAKLMYWPANPYSLGSYACWRVGQVTTIKGAEYKAIGRLFFAGEHTSGNNQGYMEGGAETGAAVAKEIAKVLA